MGVLFKDAIIHDSSKERAHPGCGTPLWATVEAYLATTGSRESQAAAAAYMVSSGFRAGAFSSKQMSSGPRVQ